MAKTNPIRFSTKWWDDETGLGNWGMRYYHPEEGRWLSRDPIGEMDYNLYGYIGNNAVNTYDLYGLFSADEAVQHCQGVIDMKTGQGDYEIKLPPAPITGEQNQACITAIETAKKADIVKRLWAQFGE